MLVQLDLARYLPRFEESPFRTIESLKRAELTDAFLADFIGMKKLHLIKLRRAIDELP
jgi:hypothetical protein